MSKKSEAHITILLDRTGSMVTIKDEVIGGYNAFLEQQQKAKTPGTFSLVQFDSQDPYEVVQDRVKVRDAQKLTATNYIPRALTPLLDAMGRCIADLASWRAEGAKTTVAVITDGQENHSREYRLNQIRQLVDEKTKLGWEFVFIGSDMGGINDAYQMGVSHQNVLRQSPGGRGLMTAFCSLSTNYASYATGESSGMSWTVADREAQERLPKGHK